MSFLNSTMCLRALNMYANQINLRACSTCICTWKLRHNQLVCGEWVSKPCHAKSNGLCLCNAWVLQICSGGMDFLAVSLQVWLKIWFLVFQYMTVPDAFTSNDNSNCRLDMIVKALEVHVHC